MKHENILQRLVSLARTPAPARLSERKTAISQLEQAIAQAQAERRAALIEAENLMARRQAEVLDLPDAEIFEIDRQIEVAELKAERLDLILPALASRLNEARSKARRAEIETAKTLYLRAISTFLESAQTTLRFGNDVIKFRDDLAGQGFRELLAMPNIPAMPNGAIVLDGQILERLADELDRSAHGVRPKAEPEIAATVAVPVAPRATASPPSVVGRTLPPVTELPLMADSDIPVDSNGNVRISILKPGIELQGQRLTGIVVLPKQEALPLLRRGAADLATDGRA